MLPLATTIECLCGREISSVTAKLNLLEDSTIVYIMQHKLCLDVRVLQPPYNQYNGCCMMQAIVECSNKLSISVIPEISLQHTHSMVVGMIVQ